LEKYSRGERERGGESKGWEKKMSHRKKKVGGDVSRIGTPGGGAEGGGDPVQ